MALFSLLPCAARWTYPVPLAIVAPQLVMNGSVVAQRHLDLAISQIESQQRDDSAAACVQDQPFGRLGLDVDGEVGPHKNTRRRQVRETDSRCVSRNTFTCYVLENSRQTCIFAHFLRDFFCSIIKYRTFCICTFLFCCTGEVK